MSRKPSAKRKQKSKALRPNSKAFWIQRFMGIFLLVLILGILAVLAVNFFKEAQNESLVVRTPQESTQTIPQSTSTATTAPKYTFYEALRKRSDEVQQELQHKIAQADKTEIKGQHYQIQIGAFSEKQHADSLRAKMILRDYPVKIINDGSLYLVQIGPYLEKETAEEVQNRLQREGIKDHVLKAYVK